MQFKKQQLELDMEQQTDFSTYYLTGILTALPQSVDEVKTTAHT